MKKTLSEKLKSKKGFSLSELLVAMIIMALALTVICAGIPAAIKAYKAVTADSEAQMALSNAVTILQGELGNASDMQKSGNALEYKNSSTGWKSSISCTNHVITVQDYVDSPMASKPGPRTLISGISYGENISIEFESISFSGNVVNIKGLAVKNSGNTVVSLDELDIRTAEK